MSEFLLYASNFILGAGVVLAVSIYLREYYLYVVSVRNIVLCANMAGEDHQIRIDRGFLIKFLYAPEKLLSKDDPKLLSEAKNTLVTYRRRQWRVFGIASGCLLTGFLGKVIVMFIAAWCAAR